MFVHKKLLLEHSFCSLLPIHDLIIEKWLSEFKVFFIF